MTIMSTKNNRGASGDRTITNETPIAGLYFEELIPLVPDDDVRRLILSAHLKERARLNQKTTALVVASSWRSFIVSAFTWNKTEQGSNYWKYIAFLPIKTVGDLTLLKGRAYNER